MIGHGGGIRRLCGDPDIHYGNSELKEALILIFTPPRTGGRSIRAFREMEWSKSFAKREYGEYPKILKQRNGIHVDQNSEDFQMCEK